MLYVQFWAPDDGRKTRLKHVQRLKEMKSHKYLTLYVQFWAPDDAR